MIYLSFTMWRVDSWDANDHFILMVDDQIFNITSALFLNGPANLCGNPVFKELPPMQLFLRTSHNKTTLNLTFISTFTEDSINESFGIRDISIIFRFNLTGELPILYGDGFRLPAQAVNYNCSPGSYPDSPTTCAMCDISCKYCYGPSNAECFECANDYFYDGEVSSKCDALCQACSGSSSNQCTKCNSTQYLNFDGSCTDACGGLIRASGGLQKCEFPCTSSQYYYPNTTCLSSCDLPWKIINKPWGKECICPDEYYLDGLGNCLIICQLPKMAVNNVCQCPDDLVEDGAQCIKDPTVESISSAMKAAILAAGASTATSVFGGADPWLLMGLVILLQMIYYLLFFNVDYPENLKGILIVFSVGRFDFLPNPFTWYYEGLKYLDSPPKFYENDVSGLFLQSSGGVIFFYILSIFVYFVCVLTTRCVHLPKVLKRIALKVFSYYGWSGFLEFMISSYLELTLSSLRQLKVITFSTYIYAIHTRLVCLSSVLIFSCLSMGLLL